MNTFQGTCPICCVVGHRDVPFHELWNCTSLRQIMSPTEFISFSRSIKYGKHHKHSICYRCHIPQINDRLHETFESKGGTCTFTDMLPGVAMRVLFDTPTGKEGCDYFACEWPDAKAYVDWLNGPPSVGHYSRLSELFLWFAETCTRSTIC